MSSTGGPPGDFSPNSSARINATIGIAAFVVIFGCVAFFITLDLCLRVLLRRYTGIIPLGGVGQRQPGTGTHVNLLNKGLDQGVIDSLLPAFVYGKEGYVGATTECAVCLSEFEDGERGRLLPKCNHAFHAGCIDMWFQSHATCPICRSPVVDNPDASSSAGAATATATATATITISESESSRDNTPASPIQVASSSSLSSEALAELQGSSSHPAAPVVIIIPRMEEDGSSTGATDGVSSARSSFHSVIDVNKEQQPEPKSPVVAATTMERLRSLGRILSRRDLGSSTQLPSPRV